MTGLLRLRVVTPGGSLINEEVAAFTGRSDFGEFCILPEHRPILASLVAGRMIVEKTGGAKVLYALDRGFMEAGPDHVNVITERCVPAEALDKTAVSEELAQAESALKDLDPTSPEAKEALDKFSWAEVRLSILENPVA